MPIDSQSSLIIMTKNLMGASSDKVSDEGFIQAATQTEKELSVTTYPVTDDIICYWMVERLRRHTTYVLMIEAAHKFQYKQIHLEHRFKHYIQLIEQMDKDWLQAMEENGELFGSVYEEFCHYLSPGFVYDSLGRDITDYGD